MSRTVAARTFGVLSGGVALLLLVAGLLKAADPVAFYQSLRGWQSLPVRATFPIATAVPPIEVSLGVAWLAGLCRRVIGCAMIALLVGFTLAILAEYRVAGDVSCGCFGDVSESFILSGGMTASVVRNVSMIFVLCAGIGLASRRGESAKGNGAT